MNARVTSFKLGILLASLASGSVGQAQTLGEALNAPNLDWTTGGTAGWVVETNTTHDGQAAASSDVIFYGQQPNWIQATVTGPTSVIFWWKTSGCVPLSLYVGGTLQAGISGLVDWQQRNFYVPPGVQTIQWTLAPGCTNSEYENMGWLDQVSFADPLPVKTVIQPTNQTLKAGDPFSLSVTAAGTEPFTYQWQHDGMNLAGETNASFARTDAQAGDSGNYSVVVTNPLGAATSQVATVTVTPSLPVFTVQPSPQGAPIGSTVSFTAVAKGSEPIGGWQWYSNDLPVTGATSATISITNVQTSALSSYWVVATNAYGSTTSVVATLSFSPVMAWGDNRYGQCAVPPTATNVVALAGGDFHFLALRADGTIIPWGFDIWLGVGSPQAEVPATATNVMGIAAGSGHSLAVREDGTVVLWGVIIGSGTTNVPSEATNVVALAQGPGAQHALALRADGTVLDWGSSDGIFICRSLTNTPVDATNIVAVAAGAHHSLALRADGRVISWGDSCSVPASASNVVAIAAGWYHDLALRADGTLIQWGSGFPLPADATNIVAFACGGNHSLALRGDGKLFAWGGYSADLTIVPAWATNVVAVAGGSYDSLALVGVGPPLLSSPLVNRSVMVGGTAFFRATAVGAWPLNYQWQLNGTDLPGATGAVLAISNALPVQAGAYSVVVSNALGIASSPGAVLTVLSPEAAIVTNSGMITKGQFSFQASGPAGTKWTVQSSTNLADWFDLTILTNATGTMTFSEPAGNLTNRFYRLQLAQ